MKNTYSHRLILLFAIFTLSIISQSDLVAQEKIQLILDEKLSEISSDFQSDILLTQITGLLVAKDGRAYITDKMNFGILVFNSQGDYQFKIGRQGRGPNEYMQIAGITFSSDSTILIADSALDRITEVNLDGNLIASYLLPESGFNSTQFAIKSDLKKELVAFISHAPISSDDGKRIHTYDLESLTLKRRTLNVYDRIYDEEVLFESLSSKLPFYRYSQINLNKVAITSRRDYGITGVYDLESSTTYWLGEKKGTPYELISKSEKDSRRENEEYGVGSSYGQQGAFHYRTLGYNEALISNKDYLIRFYTELADLSDKFELKYEIYDVNTFKLLAQSEFNELDISIKYSRISFKPLYLTDDMKLYTLGYNSNSEPVISVYNVQIK